MSSTTKRWVSAATAVFATVTAGYARADSPSCGYASKSAWNVPDGGLVIDRTGGFIPVVIDAINEWGTHTALSTGSGWATQATALQPHQQSNSCSVPLARADLSDASPGAEQVTVSALYLFYFNGNDVGSNVIPTRGGSWSNINGVQGMEWYSGNSPYDDYGYYVGDPNPYVFFPAGSNRGAQIADWEWNWPNYTGYTTGADNTYRLQSDDGNFMRYGYHQYMNMQNVYMGDDDGYVGVVCSTLHAWASWRSRMGGVLPSSTYSASQKVSAMNGLYDHIENLCNSKAPSDLFTADFFKYHVGCLGYNVCARAGNEVLNEFATDSPSTSASPWQGVRDDSSQLPYTISPDCLAGYSAVCPYNGPGSSAWGWDVPRQVTWSGPTEYACWNAP